MKSLLVWDLFPIMEGVNAEILVVCAKERKNYNADQLISLGKKCPSSA